jgi:hypothetical protein
MLGAFTQIDQIFNQNGDGSQVGPFEKPWNIVVVIIVACFQHYYFQAITWMNLILIPHNKNNYGKMSFGKVNPFTHICWSLNEMTHSKTI